MAGGGPPGPSSSYPSSTALAPNKERGSGPHGFSQGEEEGAAAGVAVLFVKPLARRGPWRRGVLPLARRRGIGSARADRLLPRRGGSGHGGAAAPSPGYPARTVRPRRLRAQPLRARARPPAVVRLPGAASPRCPPGFSAGVRPLGMAGPSACRRSGPGNALPRRPVRCVCAASASRTRCCLCAGINAYGYFSIPSLQQLLRHVMVHAHRTAIPLCMEKCIKNCSSITNSCRFTAQHAIMDYAAASRINTCHHNPSDYCRRRRQQLRRFLAVGVDNNFVDFWQPLAVCAMAFPRSVAFSRSVESTC
jgi:hypothetical protein